MENDAFNFLQFNRTLVLRDETIYDDKDIVRFRPSHEYLTSRETKSCLHCRSLIYNQSSDVKALSLDEVLIAHYSPSFYKKDTIADKVLKAGLKLGDVFGFQSRDQIKSAKIRLTKQCKITNKVLKVPILHRCNKCFKAWGIHYEMRHRLHIRNLLTSFDWSELYLPKTDNFFQGLIFLNDNSEKAYINHHITTVKALLSQDKEYKLLEAKNKIGIGDIGGALTLLQSFTKSSENSFYFNQVLQLQSRHSTFLQNRIQGILSYQEQTLEVNKISNDIISLVEEINRYKNM